MLFNSIDFAIFLPVVFLLYWFVFNKNLKVQNTFLLVASYVFYGWWDWRFLSLIFFSTSVDFFVGIGLERSEKTTIRKLLLITSLLTNLGFLGFFKYYNFFLDNLVDAFTFFGHSINVQSLGIVLPVGISFYTFQTLSYSIDVYRERLEPTKDFISFAAFVSFFPQLVAGPIERATNLLPQFYKHRVFVYSRAFDGLRQILWGLFKKMVIADNFAVYVNDVFSNYSSQTGSTLLLGAVFFAFQIYGDFSGYSDIAIGTSRLFGFSLMKNFAFPYFSRDIAEFWRRWHISLSTWFRDYLYIPLGGSKGGRYKVIRNVFIIFIVSGFWHGANWTFIAWGFLNALYFIPLLLSGNNRNHLDIVAFDRKYPSGKELMRITVTFALTVLAWIFFRSASVYNAFNYISLMFSKSLFALPAQKSLALRLILLALLMITFEWINRKKEYGFEFSNYSKITNLLLMIFLFFLVFFFSAFKGSDFIYFQF